MGLNVRYGRSRAWFEGPVWNILTVASLQRASNIELRCQGFIPCDGGTKKVVSAEVVRSAFRNDNSDGELWIGK